MIADLTVPTSDKDREKWSQGILDSVTRYSGGKTWGKMRNSYQERFNKFLGHLEVSDYKHIHSTLGKTKPMMFANYPLFEPLIQRLVGEYTSRPVPFTINRINKNAYSDKLSLMGELASEQIVAPILARIEKEHGMKMPIEQKMQYVPDQFKAMPHKSIRDALEVNLKYGLNYLYHTYHLIDENAKDLYSILINDDVMSKIDVVGNDPVIRNIPIQNCIFQTGEDNYIFQKIHQKTPFMGTDTWMTVSDIIMWYGHRMTKKQKGQLINDQQKCMANVEAVDALNADGICYRMGNGGGFEVRVVDIELKATNEKKFLKKPYVPDRTDIYFLDTINEVWEMVKCGKDICLSPRKKKNQIPEQGDFMNLQFSYFGMQSRHSMYEKGFAVQLLYNVCLMTLEFLLNQSGGKATRYASERKPDGMEYEDVAYSAKVLGIVVEQIRVGDIPGRSTAGGEVDFGPSASIQYIIALATMLVQTAERMTGVPSARSGSAAPSAPVGTIRSNIVQANFMTKPVYDVLTRHVETGLQRAADLIKYLWEGDETKSYIGGDGMPVVFKVAKNLKLADVAIYAQSSIQVAEEKDAVLQYAEKTLATDATMLLEVIKVFNSESGAEAESVLELGLGAIRANANALEKSKIEVQQQTNQIAAEELAMKKEELMIKREIPVKVARTNKESAENVALIQKEKGLNEKTFANRALLDQAEMKNQHEMQMADMEQQQPVEAAAPAQ